MTDKDNPATVPTPEPTTPPAPPADSPSLPLLGPVHTHSDDSPYEVVVLKPGTPRTK